MSASQIAELGGVAVQACASASPRAALRMRDRLPRDATVAAFERLPEDD